MHNPALKKLPLPSLKNLQTFIEVANTGSINLAADNLNITPSAVSHQISTLEAFLGRKLFIRSGKGMRINALGEDYLQQISGALNLIGRVTDKIINEPHGDILRIHSAPSFGVLWLIRRLGSFRAKHPDILINLTCSYENLQFSRDNIDIDIRHGIAQWDGYKTLTIKNERLLVMASPAYLLTHPVSGPEDIPNHNLVHSTVTLASWERWFSFHKIATRHPEYHLSFDRSYMSFEAGKMGLGLILESSLLAGELLERGELEPVFQARYAYPVNAHHLVMPHINERSRKVKVFISWIREELAAEGYEI
jgi:LysR family glycine cleavage system transcriptional activator